MRRLLLFSFALIVAGCAVGPRYQPPSLQAGDWIETPPAGPKTEEAWWRGLGDPVLDRLIEAAAADDLDIRAAEARLLEARALRAGAAADRAPRIDAGASVAENELSGLGEIPIERLPGFKRRFSLFDGGFDASWELDLWGRLARSLEGAEARAEADLETRRDVLVQTVAEVARAYVDLRSAQTRLVSAAADVEARERTADLMSARLQAGEGGRYDQQKARELARTARSDLPGLRADATAAAYRLALLTGRRPEAMSALLAAAGPLPPLPSAVGLGLRSELLRRRPDIREAERRLAAATADVAVATADLFPRISLSGDLGRQAQSLSDLGSGLSGRYALGPTLSWPVFDFGRIHAQIRASNARAQAAEIAYEKAVLTALNDSETAINRYNAALSQLREREDARARSAAALDLVRQRTEAGEDSLLSLLSAQSQLSGADQAMVVAHAAALSDLIAVYKSLGGGWRAFERDPDERDPKRAPRRQGRADPRAASRPAF